MGVRCSLLGHICGSWAGGGRDYPWAQVSWVRHGRHAWGGGVRGLGFRGSNFKSNSLGVPPLPSPCLILLVCLSVIRVLLGARGRCLLIRPGSDYEGWSINANCLLCGLIPMKTSHVVPSWGWWKYYYLFFLLLLATTLRSHPTCLRVFILDRSVFPSFYCAKSHTVFDVQIAQHTTKQKFQKGALGI